MKLGDTKLKTQPEILQQPTVLGVGYRGGASAYENGKRKKSYSVWQSMLTRCYSEKYQVQKPTYRGCTVCKEWHNFSVFEQWFNDNYIEGYELDKDSIVENNKVYSPSTCLFISRRDNTIKARAMQYILLSPDGEKVEVYNLTEFCKDNKLRQPHMCSVVNGNREHHKGWRKYSED